MTGIKICLGVGALVAFAVLSACKASEMPVGGTTTLSAAEHCRAVISSVEDAGFSDEAVVTCNHSHALIHSDSYPNHSMMNGIVGTNEQIPVPAEGYFASVQLEPVLSDIPKTRDSSVAIAVNGIPIFDYTAGGEMSDDDLYNHQPHLDTVLIEQLDNCGGHTGRGDDYHYHEKPRCMIEQMKNAGDDAIIAWGFDGFPIYGDNNPDGSTIPDGALDVCNGQPDSVFGYRYHTSDEPPYIIQCLFGEVGDLSTLSRIGTTRPSGRPVQVQNLAYTELSDGARNLSYDYRGENYYIRYQPTDKKNCYQFESKTVTNGGHVEQGEHCVSINTGPGRRSADGPPGRPRGDGPERPPRGDRPGRGEPPPGGAE